MHTSLLVLECAGVEVLHVFLEQLLFFCLAHQLCVDALHLSGPQHELTVLGVYIRLTNETILAKVLQGQP